jgi:hypothetical protein
MGWRDIVAEKTGAAPAIDEPQAQTESAGIPSRGRALAYQVGECGARG